MVRNVLLGMEPSGLIFHMRFDNNTVDSVGGINFQTNGSISYHTEVGRGVNKSAYFNGSSYLYNSEYNNLWGYNDFTYSVWAKSETSDQNYHTIIEDGSWPNTSMAIRNNPGSKFSTFMNGNDSINSYDGFNPNVWYFIVVTRKSGVMNMYINTVLRSSVNYNTSPTVSGGTTIGTSNHAKDSQEFKGYISSLRIYNRAISTDDINYLYKMEG